MTNTGTVGTPALSDTNPPELEADEAETLSEQDENEDIENEITLEISTNDTTDSTNETLDSSGTTNNDPTDPPNSEDSRLTNEVTETTNDSTSNSDLMETTIPSKSPIALVNPFHHISKDVHLHWGTFISNMRDTAIKMWKSLSERMEESLAKMPIIIEEEKPESNTKLVKKKMKVHSSKQ